jgi:dimeric dUTPase (all-alpha-NTP-PPase superfamily)
MSSTESQDRIAGMVATMARMQIAHNEQVHREWRTQGYAYHRAIWIECAELLDHYGWKWWKHQELDLDQVRLELVDIWHFGLSDLLRAGVSEGEIAGSFASLTPRPGSPDDFRDAVESFALATGQAQRFDLPAFLAVLARLPMSLTETFELYVGKNVLNHFRQDHGYKSGDYRKLWNGREDNVHLMEALAGLDCAPDKVPDALYAVLSQRYGEG